MPEIQVIFYIASIISVFGIVLFSIARLIRGVTSLIKSWREFRETRDQSDRAISQLRYSFQNYAILLIGVIIANQFISIGQITIALLVLISTLASYYFHVVFMPRQRRQ